MAPFDDWNKLDDDEEEELQDNSFFENKRDVILFCIDCSPSMQELHDDPKYENQKTCHLFTALEAAVQIQRRKIVSGPNDHVGILLFNTTMKNNGLKGQGSEIKNYTCLYQPIEPLNADTVKKTVRLLESFRQDHSVFEKTMPPLKNGRAAMGDVFTSCNWVIRDGAPKTATKRVFLITDEDDPHPGLKQLITSAQTTLVDLTEAGVNVEPFFISIDDKPFSLDKFYKEVLAPNSFVDTEDVDPSNPSVLPESVSIKGIEDLLSQMRFREVAKRAQFSIPLELGKDFIIGVKGYGLVTEQKKAGWKHFADRGDEMVMANSSTNYTDEDGNGTVQKSRVLFGMDLGKEPEQEEEEEETADGRTHVRKVQRGRRPYYTAEEIREFRTLGLSPGIKLLGFKDRDQLLFEDNVKHSLFIYPDETSYSGSKRTFSALLQSMAKKNKIGLACILTRRNASPTIYALLPQKEKLDEDGFQIDPPGIHLIPLPFDDDLREKPIKESMPASDDLVEKASKWIKKLKLRRGGYEPDSYPNPALNYYNRQLEAAAFRDPFDPDDFEDETKPKHDEHHRRAGALIEEWKDTLAEDPSANMVSDAPAKKSSAKGTKRKAATEITNSPFDDAELRTRNEDGTLVKLTVVQLKEVLKSKALPVSGTKVQLIDRLMEHLDS